MLQGMTAHYLAYSAYAIQMGDAVLIHAGAGGVGLLLIQMAKSLGARVFATVSTEEKAALAHAAGADETILYTREDFTARVRELTGGAGLPVVYDSTAKPLSTAAWLASARAAPSSSSVEPAARPCPSTRSSSPCAARST